MSSLSGGPPPSLARGEAYTTCIAELSRPHPDYERALVYAVLSLDEAVRSAVAQLGGLAEQIQLASRRR
jgi:hypothetical protein